MLKKLVKLTFVASALSIGLSGVAAAKPKFSIVKLESLFAAEGSSDLPEPGLPSIRVDWQDGQWTRIHDELLSFGVAFRVKMKRGYVHSLRIGTAGRGSRPVESLTLHRYYDEVRYLRKEERGVAFIGPTAGHDVFDTAAHLTSKQRDEIVAACNANANGDNNFTTSYDVPLAMRARGVPNKRGHGKSVTKNVIGLISFKVICDPPPQHAKNPLPKRAKPKPVSVDLKVSQQGERCPKHVTVTAYANYRSPAKSRLRVAVNGGRPKMRGAETKKLTFAGKTFHRAETQFKYKLDPGQKSFKLTVDRGEKRHSETVEIKCPPFKVTSAWLKYDIEDTPTCPKKVKETATFHTTRPGWVKHEIKMVGGLVVSTGKLTSKRVGDKYVATATRNLTVNAIDKEFMADAIDYPANSGWMGLKVKCLELSGDFSFVDKGSPKCSRTGRSLITFKSNMPDPIDYVFDCTNGEKLSGSLKPVLVGQDKYVGAAVESFEIDKTSAYSCGLRTAGPGPAKLHQWKSHRFDCVQRAVETGSNDLVPPSRPTSDAKSPFKGFTVEKQTDGVEWPGAGGVRLDVRPVIDPVKPDPRKPVDPGLVNQGPSDKNAAEKRRQAKEAKAKAERLRKAKEAKAKAERLLKAKQAKAKAERLRKAKQAKAKAERLRKAKQARAKAERLRRAELRREMLKSQAEQAEARKKAKKRSERKSSRKRRAATGNTKTRVMRLR